METTQNQSVTIQTTLNAPVKKAWETFTDPAHITKWAFASDDWHAPYADNDLREGGKFKTTMAAKDGSFQFDFGGVYTKVREHEAIEYTMEDDRKVKVAFKDNGDSTTVIQTFDTESTNSVEMQRDGWQTILDNYKKYTETI
jgi:uncharacterized protein YndB with AHSA1/START domain